MPETLFTPPPAWVHVESARYPVEGIGWGEFWVNTIGPFVDCPGKCFDEIQAMLEKYAARGECIDPDGPPVVPMRPVPTETSEFTEQVLVGACQRCGTVYWTEYAPPSEEDIAQLRAKYETTKAAEARERAAREAKRAEAKKVCEERGHLPGPTVIKSLVVGSTNRGPVAYCKRCGDPVVGST